MYVRSAAVSVPDIVESSAVRGRRCGPYLIVDLVAVVDPGLSVTARVEKFDRRGTEPIELLNINIRAEILSEFRKFYQN